MMSLPGKAIMGIVTPVGVIIALLVGVLAMVFSLKFWKLTTKKYTSASS
jgi:ABC-type uncharacterized transport system permease subunit